MKKRTQIKLMKPMTKDKFRKLTANQKRVLIAKDVLAQLALKNFIATSGRYIVIDGVDCDDHVSPRFEGEDAEKKDPLFELLNQKAMPDCHVCAVGAACCSAVRLFDEAVYKEAGTFDGQEKWLDMWATVAKYFAEDHDEMERWFEYNNSTELGGPVEIDEVFNIQSDNTRMSAIYQNIVDNGGRFKPIKFWWRKYLPQKAWKPFADQEAKRQKANQELARTNEQIEKLKSRRDELLELAEA